MKKIISKLQAKLEKNLSNFKKINNAITALQMVCDHKFEEVSHDTHHTYEQCIYCDFTRTI